MVKHSGADQVTAQISRQNGHISIELADNGKGFDTHHPDFKAGIGLSSIRQRASMIGADIDIDSVLGKGTRVKLLFSQHE